MEFTLRNNFHNNFAKFLLCIILLLFKKDLHLKIGGLL